MKYNIPPDRSVEDALIAFRDLGSQAKDLTPSAPKHSALLAGLGK
jgi:hypothetical protein